MSRLPGHFPHNSLLRQTLHQLIRRQVAGACERLDLIRPEGVLERFGVVVGQFRKYR